MPRPKVHESQRQRAAEACSFCQESKKKCSGSAPCTQCQRRGLANECHITYLPRGVRSRIRRESAAAHRQPSQAVSMQDTIAVALPSPSNARRDTQGSSGGIANNQNAPLSPSISRDDNDETASRRASESAADAHSSSLAEPGPRMLLSSHGERVYVGAAASIAFLQTVRRVVAGQIGPSNFSHNITNETMLEVETPQSTDGSIAITIEQKTEFLKCYSSVTESFIDIFDRTELESCITDSGAGPFINSLDTTEPEAAGQIPEQYSQLRRASFDLVLAIGAQCTSRQDCQTIGRALFRKAQRQALSEMIQDPDLDMVRTYLLMAFYMLGDCRRNTAYMYLSVAARAAIALGLHSPSSYKQRPLQANDKLRLRVWMTCRVGDKLVNSLLGRPATTIGIIEELDPIFTTLLSSDDHGLKCMVAAYRIVSIIDDINTKLYGEQDVRPVVVEQLLRAIDTWKRKSLPSIKQNAPQTANQMTAMESKDGSIVFISALTLQQGQKDQDSPMSEACLDAATYLAQTCVEALDTGLLESNMCIMKALVFAAGLVLGVESFAKPGVKFEVEAAFESSKRVLGFLAVRSPQASHYLDILNSLSIAIAEQRSRTAPKNNNRYVSRLFSFAPSTPRAGTPGEAAPDNPADGEVSSADPTLMANVDFSTLPDSPFGWFSTDQVDPELFIDWETVNISHWDNFPFSV